MMSLSGSLDLQEVEAPASGGYLIIGDDVVLSHCMIKDFNKSMVSPLSSQGSMNALSHRTRPQELYLKASMGLHCSEAKPSPRKAELT